jgi:hypothetical protein
MLAGSPSPLTWLGQAAEVVRALQASARARSRYFEIAGSLRRA